MEADEGAGFILQNIMRSECDEWEKASTVTTHQLQNNVKDGYDECEVYFPDETLRILSEMEHLPTCKMKSGVAAGAYVSFDSVSRKVATSLLSRLGYRDEVSIKEVVQKGGICAAALHFLFVNKSDAFVRMILSHRTICGAKSSKAAAPTEETKPKQRVASKEETVTLLVIRALADGSSDALLLAAFAVSEFNILHGETATSLPLRPLIRECFKRRSITSPKHNARNDGRTPADDHIGDDSFQEVNDDSRVSDPLSFVGLISHIEFTKCNEDTDHDTTGLYPIEVLLVLLILIISEKSHGESVSQSKKLETDTTDRELTPCVHNFIMMTELLDGLIIYLRRQSDINNKLGPDDASAVYGYLGSGCTILAIECASLLFAKVELFQLPWGLVGLHEVSASCVDDDSVSLSIYGLRLKNAILALAQLDSILPAGNENAATKLFLADDDADRRLHYMLCAARLKHLKYCAQLKATSNWGYMDEVGLVASEALVSGLSFFFSTAPERDSLLLQLLERAPAPVDILTLAGADRIADSDAEYNSLQGGVSASSRELRALYFVQLVCERASVSLRASTMDVSPELPARAQLFSLVNGSSGVSRNAVDALFPRVTASVCNELLRSSILDERLSRCVKRGKNSLFWGEVDLLLVIHRMQLVSSPLLARGPALSTSSTTDDNKKSFIEYVDALLGRVYRFLGSVSCKECPSSIDESPVLLLLASLAASVINAGNTFQLSDDLSLHLLPPFAAVSRQLTQYLATRRRARGGLLNVFDVLSERLSGSWTFVSSGNSACLPAQMYTVDLRKVEVESLHRNLNSPSMPHTVFEGRGSSSQSDIHVLGSLVGTRLSLLETWASGGQCSITGRVSLCGSFLSGRYRDEKTGRSGTIFGRKAQQTFSYDILSVSLLCSTVCGSLSGNVSRLSIRSSQQTANDDNILPRPINTDPSDDDHSGGRALVSDNGGHEAIVQKWIRSNLFSGGLILQKERLLSDRANLHPPCLSAPTGAPFELSGEIADVTRVFLTQVFDAVDAVVAPDDPYGSVSWASVSASLVEPIAKISSISANYLSQPQSSSFYDFLRDLIEGVGEAGRVDAFVSHHVGQSILSRIAGDGISQYTRRAVIASLLLHSGCPLLCIHENAMLSKGFKSEIDRPTAMLVEIWRSSQLVIEHSMRAKGKLTFVQASESLRKKSDFLMTLRPSEIAVAVADRIAEIVEASNQRNDATSSSSSSSDPGTTSSGGGGGGDIFSSVQPDIARLTTEVSEFLMSDIKHTQGLDKLLYSAAFSAIMRTSSIRAFLMIFQHIDFPGVHQLSSVASTLEQSCALHAFMKEWRSVVQAPTSTTGIEIGEHSLFSGCDGDDLIGHYSNGLHGVNDTFMRPLRECFEQLYDFSAQVFLRSLWAHDRDGQLRALMSLATVIHPEDHSFLSRIGIFHTLHTAIDEYRSVLGNISESSQSNECDFKRRFLCQQTEIDLRMLYRVTLNVTHSLASQVAAHTVPSKFPVMLRNAPRLRRMVSGPDTLSQSLFDVLYTDLFACWKSVNKTSNSKRGEFLNITGNFDGTVCLRLLRLLFYMADSAGCRQTLTGPRWMSLFVFGLFRGDLTVQKRLLCLLLRLVVDIDPNVFRVVIPTSSPDILNEIMSGEQTPSDEDINECICYARDDRPCADRFVDLILSGVSMPIAHVLVTNEGLGDADPDLLAGISRECCNFLRLLIHDVRWQAVILSSASRQLDSLRVEAEGGPVVNIASAYGSIVMLGGDVSRLHVGGTVLLKPSALASTNDSKCARLVCVSDNKGFVTSISGTTVEVVVTTDSRSDRSTLGPALLSKPKAVTLQSKDVIPLATVSAADISVSLVVFRQILEGFIGNCIPWIEVSSTDNVSIASPAVGVADFNDADCSQPIIVKSLVNVVLCKALASLLQTANTKEWLLSGSENGFDLALDALLSLAGENTDCGGLSALESTEERWAFLFDALTSKPGLRPSSSSSEANLSTCTGEESTRTSGVERPSSIEELLARQIGISLGAGSPLLDATTAAGLFSALAANGQGSRTVVDPETQSAALAQMLDMGLPREWSEVALRRCRYNVELAINMCFENGADMARIAAEEAIVQASRQAAATETPAATTDHQRTRTSLPPRESGNIRGRDSEPRRDAVLRQLLEMGFPQNWCIRAVEASNTSNLDAALSWILSNGDQLVDDDDNGGAATRGEDAASECPSAHALHPPENPLSTISGHCVVNEADLTCSTSTAGFPSVGCRGFPVTSGKWFYELKLLTAGCVQVGWADLAFEGAAGMGQGVGDDAHSWAFDGWRIYLWHEFSAEWGARCAPGDVVGCALDLDEKSMSFFLNGHSDEIGMGLGFLDFRYSGGLFPCVSFNRSEVVQFNFGSTSFAFDPPPGYAPFVNHIRSAKRLNEELLIPKLNSRATVLSVSVPCSVEPTGKDASEWRESVDEDDGAATSCRCSVKYADIRENQVFYIDNAIEELKGARDFDGKRRYFQNEDNMKSRDHDFISGRSASSQNAASASSLPSDDSRGKLIQFLKVSRELCILYARVAVLRIFSSTYDHAHSWWNSLETFLFNGGDVNQRLTALFKVCRISSSVTSRTKTYLHVMSMLGQESSPPLHLGQPWQWGGAPFLEYLRPTVSELLRRSLGMGMRNVIDQIIADIRIDTINSCRRDIVSCWQSDVGTLPSVEVKDKCLPDWTHATLPNLAYAAWLSDVAVNVIFEKYDTSTVDSVALLRSLTQNWSFALRSPSMHVKLCSFRLLLNIVNACKAKQPSCTGKFAIDIPKDRLSLLAETRIEQEKPSFPLASEYLQKLGELVAILDAECTIVEDASKGGNSHSQHDDGTWESDEAKVFCDDGWVMFSGHFVQRAIEGLPSPVQRPSERQELPPELMPGCKVVRTSTGKIEKQVPASPSDGQTAEEQIGTVLEIGSWKDQEPGSARSVRWDETKIEEWVRWDADGGVFDVTHVKMKGNKVLIRYPHPPSRLMNASYHNLGRARTYGAILRCKAHIFDHIGSGASDSAALPSVGLLELPDFGSVVEVEVSVVGNDLSIRETKLLLGPRNTGWEARFGHHYWRAGTTYALSVRRCSNSIGFDLVDCILDGRFEYTLKLAPLHERKVTGTLFLQSSHMFCFDDKAILHNVVLSADKMTVSKSGGNGQACALGSIGFSTGVHYWEFKVEQAEVGSVFLGVTEKLGAAHPSKYGRWMGYGFVNNRAAFRSATQNSSDRLTVYGDHFHSGDSVGVLLDMNRGRLSFYLDGMKYGEHIVADLGEAFDGLSSPTSVRPRTFFPIVGLSRSQDRITITPRWLSIHGCSRQEDLKLLSYAHGVLGLFDSSADKVPRLLQVEHSPHADWIVKEAWRDWLQWRSGRFMRIRSRCRGTCCPWISVDISPRSCAKASIRLGLPTALFRGDRVSFSMASGKQLDSKEEATIVGAYRGLLWYRFESGDDNSSAESTAPAWFLVPGDVEGMSIISRKNINFQTLPSSVAAADRRSRVQFHDIRLPKIPQYQGGLVQILFESGAVMRNGLEIDCSDVLCTIPADTVLYAIEQRRNSSNIVRLQVLYEGNFGWISERMRGGSEEVMTRWIEEASADELEDGILKVEVALKELDIDLKVRAQCAQSVSDAMDMWDEAAVEYMEEPLAESASGELATFPQFSSLVDSMGSGSAWTTQADLELSSLISRRAQEEGVHPLNLTQEALSRVWLSDKSDASENLLSAVPIENILARASVLRVFNQLLHHTLPYIDISLAENRFYSDRYGCEKSIDTIPSFLPRPKSISLSKNPSSSIQSLSTLPSSARITSSSSSGKSLRSVRGLLFMHTKLAFWDSILEATSTQTPLHQDEYEDPREVKTIHINRIKAGTNSLVSISDTQDRLRSTVFGQLHREMKEWSNASFRRSYLGRGHGGQRRSFKVKFIGEGVQDYGGPYRAVFEQIVDELQADSVLPGRRPSEKCLLPLFLPCPNRHAGTGANQYKFTLTTAVSSPLHKEYVSFFGKLLGTAMRHNLTLALDLSTMVWRPLVGLPLTRSHLQTVDTLFASHLNDVTEVGLALEKRLLCESSVDLPPEWADLTFCMYLPDGSRVPLVPDGDKVAVTTSNWREYVRLAEKLRLLENASAMKCFLAGLSAVIPVELLPIFTEAELEKMVSGTSNVDVKLLRQCTEYEDISPESEVVKNFWCVLESFTPQQRTLFLRFVWARSRMPASAQDLPMTFRLQGAQGRARDYPDSYLPHAQTCFFSLSLPNYSTLEILRSKLLYAISHSPNMDADIRLHNAEGWAD